jgi:hypothetical protein
VDGGGGGGLATEHNQPVGPAESVVGTDRAAFSPLAQDGMKINKYK